MQFPLFTTEQLKFLNEIYGINPLEDVVEINGARVIRGRKHSVWLKAKDGPVRVDVDQQWSLIKAKPKDYFSTKPKGAFVYEQADSST